MESIYMNRELSWLKFNARVLEEAESQEVPLCERMTFVSIYQSNLDEFFMVRVGSLQEYQRKQLERHFDLQCINYLANAKSFLAQT